MFHGRGPTEDQAAGGIVQHGGANFTKPGIKRNGLFRDTGLEERLGHAPRGPRLLGTRFEHETHLQRDDRQPETVHTGRIGWQHHTHHRRGRLVAAHDAVFLPIATSQNVVVQPPRQRPEHLIEMTEHVLELAHVHPTHVLRQTGRRRLLPHEVVRRLRAFAKRQLRRLEELAPLLDHGQQVRARNLAQRVTRPFSPLAQVAGDHSGVGLTDFGHRLTRNEMVHLGRFETGIRLSPPEYRKVNHGSIDPGLTRRLMRPPTRR